MFGVWRVCVASLQLEPAGLCGQESELPAAKDGHCLCYCLVSFLLGTGEKEQKVEKNR